MQKIHFEDEIFKRVSTFYKESGGGYMVKKADL